MTLLPTDLGSCKALVGGVKSQLLLAEGCKTLPGAGKSPRLGTEEPGHAQVLGCPLLSIAPLAEIRAKGLKSVSPI